MASSDKALGKLSAAFTLVVLAGVLAVPFLPMRHIERKSAVPRPSAEAIAKPNTESSKADADAQSDAEEEADASDHDAASSEPAADSDEAKTTELTEWSTQEQADALRSCVKLLAPLNVEVDMSQPMRKGRCGSAAPVLLHSIGGAGKVTLDPAPEMNCRLVAALARWVDTVLQPAAREVLGSRVTHIVGASSYACRTIYNLPNKPLSEHATANAIDIAAFSLADGRMIRVVKGWGPTERDIAAARKKLEEAKRAKASGKTGDDDKARAKDGEGKQAEGKAAVQKARLESKSKDKDQGEEAKAIPVAATLTAAETAQSAFLKRLHHGACGVFATVLGPEANDAHRNHFHFDMKERKSGRRYCH